MIIERYRLLGVKQIMKKVTPTTSIEQLKNNPHLDKEKTQPHDTVLCYCPASNERIEIVVYYSGGQNDFFQMVNLPEKMINNLDDRKLYCNHCGNTILLEKQSEKIHNNFFHLKIDCSQMSPGMESWYENDSLPNKVDDGHPRKF